MRYNLVVVGGGINLTRATSYNAVQCTGVVMRLGFNYGDEYGDVCKQRRDGTLRFNTGAA